MNAIPHTSICTTAVHADAVKLPRFPYVNYLIKISKLKIPLSSPSYGDFISKCHLFTTKLWHLVEANAVNLRLLDIGEPLNRGLSDM